MLLKNVGGHDIIFVGLGIYIKDSEILCISDPHIGGWHFDNSYVAERQFQEVLDALISIKRLLEEKGYRIRRIVVNGDIKEEFGYSKRAREYVSRFLLFLKKEFKDYVIVIGNHDTGIDGKKYYISDNVFFCHGDVIFDIPDDVDLIVIGHQHPAFRLRLGTKVETYKCYVLSSYEGRDLIVLPNFNPDSRGTPLNATFYFSPYLREEINSLILVDGKTVIELTEEMLGDNFL